VAERVSKAIEIVDAADPRLDDFRNLTTADRRPDRPGGRGLVIAEGTVVVRRLLSSRYPVRALLGVRRRWQELRAELETEPAPYFVTSPELMTEVVGFHLNRGVLATADRFSYPPVDDLLAPVSSAVLLEGVGDAENLGSIFRNAAALGIGAVLLGDGCGDPLYRRSVRVSMGTVLLEPFGALPGAWPRPAEVLRDAGFTVAALTPLASAIPLRRANLAGRRIALVLGSEGPGLTDAALAAADLHLRIPMAPGIDSLNVATAGAIAFAELSAAP